MSLFQAVDWPLSREEKKSRVLDLFHREVTAADAMLRSKDIEIESLRGRIRRSCPGPFYRTEDCEGGMRAAKAATLAAEVPLEAEEMPVAEAPLAAEAPPSAEAAQAPRAAEAPLEAEVMQASEEAAAQAPLVADATLVESSSETSTAGKLRDKRGHERGGKCSSFRGRSGAQTSRSQTSWPWSAAHTPRCPTPAQRFQKLTSAAPRAAPLTSQEELPRVSWRPTLFSRETSTLLTEAPRLMRGGLDLQSLPLGDEAWMSRLPRRR